MKKENNILINDFIHYMIKVIVLILIVAFIPTLCEHIFYFVCDVIIPNDMCLWNDGGKCPICKQ